MIENLMHRITAVASATGGALVAAEGASERALAALRPNLANLFDAADMIRRRSGTTLDGRRFSFSGSAKKPTYNPANASFLTHVYEAHFAAGGGTFGLAIELDANLTVTLIFTGAAAALGPMSWPVSAADYARIGDLFVTWLSVERLYFPAER
jgi:hypothetical protein